MENNQDVLCGMEISEKDACQIMVLAVIGGIAIMGAVGIGAYKLSEFVTEKVWDWSTRRAGLKAGKKAKESIEEA